MCSVCLAYPFDPRALICLKWVDENNLSHNNVSYRISRFEQGLLIILIYEFGGACTCYCISSFHTERHTRECSIYVLRDDKRSFRGDKETSRHKEMSL